MKKILPEYEFTQEQLHTVSALAKTTGLTEQTVRILFARGVDTDEKISSFMSPSAKNFLSPFLMQGMAEAVDALKKAKEEMQTVVVFGDYDADGVCASAIVYHALKIYGIDAKVYIPERSDGYGLSEGMIDRIFEECQPDLFLTVDCGVSCAKEAQYIYELGADVVITDHHELPEILPDCVLVNPKLADDYPYDNLCGAGVAFKLACALIGERAYQFLDFAALATVADSVPLLGENRDIVTEGLKLFNASPRACFSALLDKNYEEITAQTLAYSVAPRINAAGRMGDARAAFELFISENLSDITSLATLLCSYNLERQKCCDELYQSAKEKLNEKGAYGNVIMLWDESWNTGFVGIVAAKLAEEYNRPTLLFVRHDDALKGSARSIENVNIFTALKECSEYIEEFGGHSQAAGVNVTVENFDALEKALNETISARYDKADLEQRIYVSGQITTPMNSKFAKELVALEPYGVGHKRPLFSLTAEACDVKKTKIGSPHLSIKNENLEMMYFSGAKHLGLIGSDVKKQFVVEINVSKFKGREYIKGFVRDLVYDGMTGEEVSTDLFVGATQRMQTEEKNVSFTALSTVETEELIERKNKECAYGLCLVASDRDTVARYKNLKDFGLDLFYPMAKGNANTLIVSPAPDTDFSGYRDIVFLDVPTEINGLGLYGKN
ncbi:MAG: single-stranded-DNA-specific exonuclease RecJ, partial [Clostridia bacterium]|nr:single-stranded-DNA-specific exonuclease RecJ [Clostridia bacterium]